MSRMELQQTAALRRIIGSLQPRIRREFPALRRDMLGGRRTYLNNAGGTIVAARSAAAMSAAALWANAQDGEITAGEINTAMLHAAAREAAAAFLNAPSAAEISFHQSASHALFNLSFAMRRSLRAGDNLVVSALDHAANVTPWETVRDDRPDVRVRVCRLRSDGTLDLDHLHAMVDRRTRVVAVTRASNGLGTVMPIAEVARIAHRHGRPRPGIGGRGAGGGALLVVDAVHYAPHGPIDVRAEGADFLVFSGYKLFGPMLGVLWGRRAWLDALRPYRVEANPDVTPTSWEQGTPNHAVLMGFAAAVDYLDGLGGAVERAAAGEVCLAPLRRRLRRTYPDAMARRLKWAMHAVRAWEQSVSETVLRGWRRDLAPRGVRLHGPTDPARVGERVPTFLFDLPGRTQEEVKKALWRLARIEVPSGNYYSVAVYRHLRLHDTIRASFAHYDSPATARLLVRTLARIAGRPRPQRRAAGSPAGRPRPVAR
jgi:selenocysteine lyase/cysteine desulfurase